MGKRRIITGIVVVMAVIGLAGCSNSGAEYDDPNTGLLESRVFITKDGRHIECATTGDYRGGVSCDWEHPLVGKDQ